MTEIAVRSRRQEYAEATREALLDTARTLFVEHGYNQAGVDAIARAARVTRGAFYHHFPDKLALFEALVIRLQAHAFERVTAAAANVIDPFERLRVGSATFLEICTEPSYRRLVIEDAPAVLGALRCRAIEDQYTIGLMVSALVKKQQAGQFDSPDPKLAARMIASMLCEAALQMAVAKNPNQIRRAALEIVGRTLSAFRPSPPEKD
jgi:AcrR family transcriptional regulator